MYVVSVHLITIKWIKDIIIDLIGNESWRQHPTKQQLYGHVPPISKTSKLDEQNMQDTAGEGWTNS